MHLAVGAKHWHALSLAFRVDLKGVIKIQVKVEGHSRGLYGRTSSRVMSLGCSHAAESLPGLQARVHQVVRERTVTQGRWGGRLHTGPDTFHSFRPVLVRTVIHSCVTLPQLLSGWRLSSRPRAGMGSHLPGGTRGAHPIPRRALTLPRSCLLPPETGRGRVSERSQ